MATTTLTVGTTTYSSTDRAAMGMAGIDSLKVSVDEYCELEFTIYGCGPLPTFLAGTLVALTVDGTVVFSGNIVSTNMSQGNTGWHFAFHCLDLKWRGDWVSIGNRQGSAVCSYNLDPDDLDYDPNFAGFTVGQIVLDVLQVYSTGLDLFSLGVGGYTFGVDGMGNPTAILNATTVADLGFLSIIPNCPVRIEGDAIISILQQFIATWHPQMCLWVQPFDGVIRVRSPFTGFTTFNITVPGATTPAADNCDWPELVAPDISNCWTQYQIIGQDIDTAYLNTFDGTLTPFNSSGDRSSWNLNYHLYPTGTSVYGSVTITSSTSADVTCDDPTVSWASGFWPAIGGTIFVINTTATGLAIMERRLVTSNTALTAGGTCSIGWDSGNPLDNPTYDRFGLVGSNNPLAYVDRLFWVTDPSTGDVGTDTYIGANLRDRDPNGIQWSNNGQFGPVLYAAAKVLWSINGDNATPALRWPMQELPVGVKILKATGQVLLDDPACLIAALAAGSADGLFLGYPTSAVNGLWYGLVVAVPYSRGPLVAQYPSSGFAGSAFSDYAVSKVKRERLDSYTSRLQNANMIALATEKAVTMQDAHLEGSIAYHGLPSERSTSPFNQFAQGIALNIIMPATSPLDSRPVPVRTAVIRWPHENADIYQVSFRFSNRKAPFQGDSRYIHPNFTRDASSNAVFWEQPTIMGGVAGQDRTRMAPARNPMDLPGRINPFDPNAIPGGGMVGPPSRFAGQTLPNTAGGAAGAPRRPSGLPNTASGSAESIARGDKKFFGPNHGPIDEGSIGGGG